MEQPFRVSVVLSRWEFLPEETKKKGKKHLDKKKHWTAVFDDPHRLFWSKSFFLYSILSLFSTKQEINKKGSEIVLYHLDLLQRVCTQPVSPVPGSPLPSVITLRRLFHSGGCCQMEEVALISFALVSLRTADRFRPQPKRKRSFSNSAACETRPPSTWVVESFTFPVDRERYHHWR